VSIIVKPLNGSETEKQLSFIVGVVPRATNFDNASASDYILPTTRYTYRPDEEGAQVIVVTFPDSLFETEEAFTLRISPDPASQVEDRILVPLPGAEIFEFTTVIIRDANSK